MNLDDDELKATKENNDKVRWAIKVLEQNFVIPDETIFEAIDVAVKFIKEKLND